MHRSLISGVVASALMLVGVTYATSHSLCRPKLNVTDVHFSKMTPPTMERRWTATVTVDGSTCVANASGNFELGITRQKESGYELDFRERFIWLVPSVKISVDFSADEAVEQYWIENVTPCRCED